MKYFFDKSLDEKKRVVEFFLMILSCVGILLLSRLETRLFSLSEILSENKEFFSTLAYFALINLNVILILFLSFLIFRNVTKLIVERKRGVLGAKLRTKLVFALVFFALAPTVLLFYVSMKFMASSFDNWFSEKIQITMQQTREAGSQIYKRDQKRLQGLAKIALQRVELGGPSDIFEPSSKKIVTDKLAGFVEEYGINDVKVYSVNGSLLWSHEKGAASEVKDQSDAYALDSIRTFLADKDLSDQGVVVGEEHEDVVKGLAPIKDPQSEALLGLIITEVRFETQILKSIEKIIVDFANLKPGAQLIRLSYMVLMIVMTLLIVFSATWLGFYVARGITGPLQSLAEATKEIALGNYNISLKQKADDETGQLVHAFNLMTSDLKEHQKTTEQAQLRLQSSNLELDRRRQYMEIVLKHITAGVISLDSLGRIASVNSAAERLLGINANHVKLKTIKSSCGPELYEIFWQPLAEAFKNHNNFQREIEIRKEGLDVTLIVTGTRIYDEHNVEVGAVIVFDDAREQVKAQRVAAWREVARRIAHEIKNPITPIKLNAQRLLRRYQSKFTGEDKDVFENCIETIITQVDSLRDLVNEFSKFSKLPKIEPKLADINTVLADVSTLFRMSYPEIEIKTSLGEVPLFFLDKEQLNRVFVNLFTNAISSLEETRSGFIELSSVYVQQLNAVRIELADNGCGIPKGLSDRVLEPYFSTKDEGTGLGLAIVNQVVTDHRGYLRLTVNKPFGTKAIIELPVGIEKNQR